MKGKRLIAVVAGLASLGLMSATALAQNYIIPSHAEVDPSFPGDLEAHAKVAESQLTKEDAERYPFVWWRDTTYQNALWSHSTSQFPNTIVQAYADSGVKVLVFASQAGSNVVAIVGPTGNTIVGAGGSRNAARLALGAFANALDQTVPDFQLDLKAIILPSASPDTIWGAAEFIGDIERPEPVRVFAHTSILQVGAIRQAVWVARVNRELYTMGPELRYGPNGNLGVGSLYGFNPYQPNNGFVTPNQFIAADTTITAGGVSMRLIPTGLDDASLTVWLQSQKVIVGGPLHGKYFPPFGEISGLNSGLTTGPVTKWIASLDVMRQRHANVLVPMHTLPITGAADVDTALEDQRSALWSIHQQTVEKINQMMPLDDIVATVKIPDALASKPYLQPFASTVEAAVREIYHYYMGWFDGKASSLNTLSEAQQASFLVDLAGGPEKALQAAQKLNSDHTLAGVQKAIVILEGLRMVSPSQDADRMYIQALRKMAYAQSAGQIRNYYLLMAQREEAALGGQVDSP